MKNRDLKGKGDKKYRPIVLGCGLTDHPETEFPSRTSNYDEINYELLFPELMRAEKGL